MTNVFLPQVFSSSRWLCLASRACRVSGCSLMNGFFSCGKGATPYSSLFAPMLTENADKIKRILLFLHLLHIKGVSTSPVNCELFGVTAFA